MSGIATKVIAITNHKGGCGKTTTAVQLAAELGRQGYSVLLVDLDPQSNASLHVGKLHPSEVLVNASQLLLGDLDLLPRAVIEETEIPNVSLICGHLSLNEVEEKLRDQSPRPNEELKEKLAPTLGVFDFIIIDTPPSLKLLTSNALAAATHIIIPIESGSQYGMYGVSDLVKHLEKVKRINPKLVVLGALLTKHDDRTSVSKIIENAARQEFGVILNTKIPSSTKVNQAAMVKSSVHQVDRSAKVARAFTALAAEICEKLNMPVMRHEAELEESSNV
ncbi:ParA family protein [Burkholderiaceae bacterium DAT-1]|nr:ParA family protein [Burkholderiaceae bacterium DAT-1]